MLSTGKESLVLKIKENFPLRWNKRRVVPDIDKLKGKINVSLVDSDDVFSFGHDNKIP